MFLFFFPFYLLDFTSPGEHYFELTAGKYVINCYGGQGGGGYHDTFVVVSDGGKGAWVKGSLLIKGTPLGGAPASAAPADANSPGTAEEAKEDKK